MRWRTHSALARYRIACAYNNDLYRAFQSDIYRLCSIKSPGLQFLNSVPPPKEGSRSYCLQSKLQVNILATNSYTLVAIVVPFLVYLVIETRHSISKKQTHLVNRQVFI